MKNTFTILIAIVLISFAGPVAAQLKTIPASAKAVYGEPPRKNGYTPAREKKAIRNFTHTRPAQGAMATTRMANRKYKKIEKLHLKNSGTGGTRAKNNSFGRPRYIQG